MPRRRSAMPTLPAADFLVIGSGVAGLRAAIGLSRAGRVLVLTKGSPAESSSIYAQGGVAVASRGGGNSPAPQGTLRAGGRVCPAARREGLRGGGPVPGAGPKRRGGRL